MKLLLCHADFVHFVGLTILCFVSHLNSSLSSSVECIESQKYFELHGWSSNPPLFNFTNSDPTSISDLSLLFPETEFEIRDELTKYSDVILCWNIGAVGDPGFVEMSKAFESEGQLPRYLYIKYQAQAADSKSTRSNDIAKVASALPPHVEFSGGNLMESNLVQSLRSSDTWTEVVFEFNGKSLAERDGKVIGTIRFSLPGVDFLLVDKIMMMQRATVYDNEEIGTFCTSKFNKNIKNRTAIDDDPTPPSTSETPTTFSTSSTDSTLTSDTSTTETSTSDTNTTETITPATTSTLTTEPTTVSTTEISPTSTQETASDPTTESTTVSITQASSPTTIELTSAPTTEPTTVSTTQVSPTATTELTSDPTTEPATVSTTEISSTSTPETTLNPTTEPAIVSSTQVSLPATNKMTSDPTTETGSTTKSTSSSHTKVPATTPLSPPPTGTGSTIDHYTTSTVLLVLAIILPILALLSLIGIGFLLIRKDKSLALFSKKGNLFKFKSYFSSSVSEFSLLDEMSMSDRGSSRGSSVTSTGIIY